MITEHQYNNEKNIAIKFELARNEGIPREYFVACALASAKAVLPVLLTDPECYNVCFNAVDRAERYCYGEVTREACKVNSNLARIAANTFDNNLFPQLYAAGMSAHYAAWAACCPHEEFHFFSGVCVMAAINAVEKTESTVNILEIVKDHLSWDHLVSIQIANTLSNYKQSKTIKIMRDLLDIPKQDREKLFQYAEVIFGCDGLNKESVFLIKDFIKKKIPSKSRERLLQYKK